MGRLTLNQEYREWLQKLKEQIRQRQIKAAFRVNEELLRLYWELGRNITERQKNAQWGSGFLRQLSLDLCKEFPYMKGFSLRNLKYIRLFYQFYRKYVPIGQQPVAQLCDCVNLTKVERGKKQSGIHVENDGMPAKGQQPVAQFPKEIFCIPWGHHVTLMTKCKSVEEALFYIQKTIEGNWSRSVLLNMLDTGLYEAGGRAITNFASTLPDAQGDLARQTLKDPYIFDFLTMRSDYDERELENALTSNITRFLLELGTGFAYVGRQVRLEVGNQEFFLDLLFYHLKLRCYIVVELKTTPFEPSYLGQLGFYVTAVNEQMRHPADGETIGLLICKEKNKVVAEYALKGMEQPLSISEYRLGRFLPDDIRASLPSIEEIEAELSNAESIQQQTQLFEEN